jgi:hypothetical protein
MGAARAVHHGDLGCATNRRQVADDTVFNALSFPHGLLYTPARS